MKTNGPTKRLFVDDKNQDKRKKKSQNQAGKICQQAKQSGFRENQLPQLFAGCAQITQEPEFAPAVDDQRQKRSGDAHHSDDDSHGFEGVGDGKSAVEDLHGLAAQITVRENHNPAVCRRTFDFSPDRGNVHTRLYEDCEIRWRRVRKIFQHNVAVHEDYAAFAAVIVIDVGDTEAGARFAESELDRIAGSHVMFVGERLADYDCVRAAEFSEYRVGRTAGKKIRVAIDG